MIVIQEAEEAAKKENRQDAARNYASSKLKILEDGILPVLAPFVLFALAYISYKYIKAAYIKEFLAVLSTALGLVFALIIAMVKCNERTRAFIEKRLIKWYEMKHTGGTARKIYAALLVVVLAAPFVFATMKPPGDRGLVWSDWADHLPTDINGENSAIECKLQYRSARLYRVEGENPQEEGYTILRTEYGEGYGDYTWVDSPTSEDESIEVSSDVVEYQYLRKVEYLPDRPGLYNSIPPKYVPYWTDIWKGKPLATRYGSRPRRRIDICYKINEWSEFTDGPLLPNDETIVNTRMQYRYAETENGRVAANSSMDNFLTSSADYTGRFADVDDANAWYGAKNSDALRTVSELGIFLPDSELRFHPDDPITIGQAIRAAVMIHRIYHGCAALLDENNGQYQVYADYAAENGIIARGEFPDLSKTAARQELAYILSGSLPEEELPERTSAGVISDMDSRYYDCVLGLAKAGVVNLDNGNKFHPEDPASRAQTASMIDRLIYPEHRVGRGSQRSAAAEPHRSGQQ